MHLAKYMKKFKQTQQSMATKLGITISHLRMVMCGKSTPSKGLSIKIEEVTEGTVTKEEAIFFNEYYGDLKCR